MAKFQVSSKITKFKPSKRQLIIAGAVLFMLILFVIGLVSQVKAERAERAVQAAQTAEYEDMKAENAALKTEVGDLKTAKDTAQSNNKAICEWVRGVQAQRRQAVPPLCQPVKQ